MSADDFQVVNVITTKNSAGKTFITVSVKGAAADDADARDGQVEALRERVSQLFTMATDHMVSGVVDVLNARVSELEAELERVKTKNSQLSQENTVLRRSAGWNSD